MTHAELVEAAKRWLWKYCSVVISEMANIGEEADAIGWQGTLSHLVECKASLADYRRDKDKPWRRNPDMGLGMLRYYCTPPYLIGVDTLPENWGLICWDGDRMRVVRKPQPFTYDRRAEVALLLSALRRTGAFAPSGVSVKCYVIQTQCRATLGVEPIIANATP